MMVLEERENLTNQSEELKEVRVTCGEIYVANINDEDTSVLPNETSQKENLNNGITLIKDKNDKMFSVESLRHIFTELDSHVLVDDNVLEILNYILENFIQSIIQHSHTLARHRNSPILQTTDLWAHLKRDWNILPHSLLHIQTRQLGSILSSSARIPEIPHSFLNDLVSEEGSKLHSHLLNILNEQSKFHSDDAPHISRHRVRTSGGTHSLQKYGNSHSTSSTHHSINSNTISTSHASEQSKHNSNITAGTNLSSTRNNINISSSQLNNPNSNTPALQNK